MTAKRSTNRLNYRLLSLALLCWTALPAALAGEVPLRSFAATYDVAVGERRIGSGEIRLQPDGGLWQFSSLSKARGIYALMTRRQPTTRSRFSAGADGLRLREIRVGDANDEQAREAARFDWRAGRLYIERKGRLRRLGLDRDSEIFDLLTIHWLAADLALSDRRRARFELYRRGRLLASELAYLGTRAISLQQRKTEARVYEHAIDGKSIRLRYYYAMDNPLLPLRIEKTDRDEVTVMSLTGVEWDL